MTKSPLTKLCNLIIICLKLKNRIKNDINKIKNDINKIKKKISNIS